MTTLAATASAALPDTQADSVAALLAQGNARQSVAAAERFLADARSQGRAGATATALAYLGAAHRMAGHLGFAAECLAEAKRLAEASGEQRGHYLALQQEGQIHLDIGQFADAIDTFRRVADAALVAGDNSIRARTFTGLGIACARMQDYAQAREYYQEALDLQRPLHDDGALANTMNCIGMLEIRIIEAGQARGADAQALVSRAVAVFEEALPMAQNVGRARLVSQIIGNIGRAYNFSHDYARAIEFGMRSIVMTRELDAPSDECETQANLAESYVGLNALDRAHEACAASLALATQLASVADEKRAHNIFADICEARGDPAAAYQHLKRARELDRVNDRAQALERLRRFALAEKMRAAEAETLGWRQRASDLGHSNTLLSARANELDRIAHADPLTGASNRRHMDNWLASAHLRACTTLAVALCDVDHFKAINDNFGHAVGDVVLREIVARIQSHCRDTDLVVRYGGEEFLLFFPETTTDAVCRICERIRENIATTPWQCTAAGLAVTASFGIASQAAPLDVATLIARADQALYAAKHAGRNRVLTETVV